MGAAARQAIERNPLTGGDSDVPLGVSEKKRQIYGIEKQCYMNYFAKKNKEFSLPFKFYLYFCI